MKRKQTMWFIERISKRSSWLLPFSGSWSRAGAWSTFAEAVKEHNEQGFQSLARAHREKKQGHLRAVKVFVDWKAKR